MESLQWIYDDDIESIPHLRQSSVEPEHDYWQTDTNQPGAAVYAECYTVHSSQDTEIPDMIGSC